MMIATRLRTEFSPPAGTETSAVPTCCSSSCCCCCCVATTIAVAGDMVADLREDAAAAESPPTTDTRAIAYAFAALFAPMAGVGFALSLGLRNSALSIVIAVAIGLVMCVGAYLSVGQKFLPALAMGTYRVVLWALFAVVEIVLVLTIGAAIDGLGFGLIVGECVLIVLAIFFVTKRSQRATEKINARTTGVLHNPTPPGMPDPPFPDLPPHEG